MMVPEVYIDEYLEDEAFVDELLTMLESGACHSAPPEPKGTGKSKVVWKAVSNIIFCVALVLACFVAVICATNAGDRGARDIAGFYVFNVLSGSMQREIPKGSLVLVKKTDPNLIKLGQNITFFSNNGNKTTTHKVVGILGNFDENGKRGFETKGVENISPDLDITHADNVLGVVILSIPLLGSILQFVKDHLLLILLWFGGLLALSFFLRIALGKPRKSKEEKKQEGERKPRKKKEKKTRRTKNV